MLKKLSLAALVAMGSVSFASATPLTEAIKNVNFGGYLRLRFYHESDNKPKRKYRTTALFKFSVPVSEELKFNTAYAFDWSISSGGTTANEITSGSDITNVKFFLQYNKDNLTALVGKIPVPTPITATGVGEATAAGLIALYKVNDNITVVAAGLDAMVGNDQVKTDGKNVYAISAIYNDDSLNMQGWIFNVDNRINSDIVLMANYKVNNSIKIRADFATASLDDKKIQSDIIDNNLTSTKFPGVKGVESADISKTQTYFNISAVYAQDQLCAQLGYAQTGKDGGIVNLDADSPLNDVFPTEQITGITDTTDTTAFYAKVGYKVDAKTNVFVGGVTINDDNDKTTNDFIVGAKYQYTKKMQFYAYYDMLDTDKNSSIADNDNKEFRFEAKYSF